MPINWETNRILMYSSELWLCNISCCRNNYDIFLLGPIYQCKKVFTHLSIGISVDASCKAYLIKSVIFNCIFLWIFKTKK